MVSSVTSVCTNQSYAAPLCLSFPALKMGGARNSSFSGKGKIKPGGLLQPYEGMEMRMVGCVASDEDTKPACFLRKH